MMLVADEHVLLAQIARGDEEALHQLYLAYRPRLRRYLWHQLDGDAAGVEEALQDVFLAVWRSAGRYRAEARVSTWVFQIAHYVALGARRRSVRRSQVLRIEPPEDETQAAAGWHEAADETWDDAVLNRLSLGDALGRLSSSHRAVLILVFQHGFSLEEVARILDVPTGTVKSRVSYARKALLRALCAAPVEELRHDA